MCPQQAFPNDFLYVERVCPRCKKKVQFLRTDTHKYCPSCRKYAISYKRRHRPLKLTKQDLADLERENARKTREESIKYGTNEPNCRLWRRMYEHNQRSDWWFNHLECKSCAAWYAKNKRDSLDINAGMNGITDELKGYEEVFAEKKGFVEDNIYCGGGVFPMTTICSECGTPLRGSPPHCPVCNPMPDD